MTSRKKVPLSSFGHVLSTHGRDASWIFSLCDFGHYNVLIMSYLCSVLNLFEISVIVTEIDAHGSDIRLMTSRELTSGFDFWSRGHLRMAVLHLPI